jgi:hypothetical protein
MQNLHYILDFSIFRRPQTRIKSRFRDSRHAETVEDGLDVAYMVNYLIDMNRSHIFSLRQKNRTQKGRLKTAWTPRFALNPPTPLRFAPVARRASSQVRSPVSKHRGRMTFYEEAVPPLTTQI